MGDRCYMSVTCRRVDQEQFAALGFQIEYDNDPASPIVEMIDDEANYGHYDEMPTDIPYTAQYSSGSNYGPGSIACDGKHREEVSATTDGFVLAWNYRWNLPTFKSILKTRRFIKTERRVTKEFKALRKTHRKEHLFSPDTNQCVYCGNSAKDDLVENSPCNP